MDKPQFKNGFFAESCLAIFVGVVLWLSVGILLGGGTATFVVISMIVMLKIMLRAVGGLGWISGRVYRILLNVALIPAFFAGLLIWNQYVQYRTRKYVVESKEYRSFSGRYFSENLASPVYLAETPTLRIGAGHPRLDGATSLGGLLVAFAGTAYRDAIVDPRARWGVVQVNRTPYAYQKLINNECDLILAFRPSEEQLSKAKAKGRTLRMTPVGREAFVFFVNKRNPVDTLSLRQLRDIYGGDLTNWRDASGGDRPIIAFQRISGSGSQSRLERFMKGREMMVPPMELRLGGMMDIVAGVSDYHNYPNAIGYSFLYYVQEMLKASEIKVLAVDGVHPDLETIQDGSYPLLDDICAVTSDRSAPAAEQLVEWMLSPQGQRLVRANGYVPIGSEK